MNLPKPLNNNALIEITNEFAAVARDTAGESQKKGTIVDCSISRYHLTASAGVEISQDFMMATGRQLREAVEAKATVYWEEFANEGQMFDIMVDGVKKQYAFVAWWRLTGVEMPEVSSKTKGAK